MPSREVVNKLFPSHPTRVRGLKHGSCRFLLIIPTVAPHAGAWIETDARLQRPEYLGGSHPTRVRGLKRAWGATVSSGRKSHPTRVRGLKQHVRHPRPSRPASHPTRVRGLKPCTGGPCGPCARSHPTRVRGLKPNTWKSWKPSSPVAPHAGAWIETLCRLSLFARLACRTPRGCVD